MDTTSFNPPVVETVKTSRLPAGSTLEVNGIHVPHPHAEVNLPGAGDPRVGDTKAVTETVKVDGDGNSVVEQRPLDESVKPKVVTVAGTPDATEADKVLTVEQPTPEGKTE